MNRVRSKRCPDTVCEVVWQRKQFSWTRIAPCHLVVRDPNTWREAVLIARLFLNGARITQIGDATHYHSVNVQLVWSESSRLMAQIGGHLFYTL